MVIVCSNDTLESVPIELQSALPHAVSLSALTTDDKLSLASLALCDEKQQSNLSELFAQTAAMTASEAHFVLENATTATVVKQRLSDWMDSKAKLPTAQSLSQSIPNVKWSDIGGLEHVKKQLLTVIELPLRFPHLFQNKSLRKSAVLLCGPPGNGKTLIAKAIATECSLHFMHVKGPELLNMYVGESEKNVRELFRAAKNAKPCVVFFDEVDALAPNRGHSGDGGNVMNRIVSQLLAELDGANELVDVFFVAATNRPDLLDSALLRPGRFDKVIYVGVPKTHEHQLKVLQALTHKFTLAADVDLAAIVEKCPFNFTGSDFLALSSDAMLSAIKRQIAAIDSAASEQKQQVSSFLGHLADDDPLLAVVVTMQDFEGAFSRLTPCLTVTELAVYERMSFATQN